MTAVTEPRLSENLSAQRECAQRLLGLLQNERSALLANDVSALEMLTAAKAQAADHLSRLGQDLEHLRVEARVGSLGDLIARYAAGASATWRALGDLSAQCLQSNRDNASLLSARQQQIRSALRVLLPGTADAQVYGRGGYSGMADGSRSLGLA